MRCLFCNSIDTKIVLLPLNEFNGKSFKYYRCKKCRLLFIDPIPDKDDLEKMYPTSYQGKIIPEKTDLNIKMPGLRFTYAKQIEIIKSYLPKEGIGCDFGCGSGHFIYNAYLNNLKLNGVEFSVELIQGLSSAYPFTTFYTIDDFYSSSQTYDFIRLSNVLEHFTKPQEEFSCLLRKLKSGGFVLIEGPLEQNRSLVNWIKWTYLKIRKWINKEFVTNHAPTHIFFSNYNNQKLFLESMGLTTTHYLISENAWPFPESIKQVDSLGKFIKYIIGRISIALSKIVPNYGNTFLYVGRKVGE
jgi:2-polyprenyl-3-methyl-5-hydroxy-6-metoxy-1,4-benzoquinol methylase